MKLAIVYDWVNKLGGAERILQAVHEIWPDAPLYTLVYDKKKAEWAKIFDIKTSFLNQLYFLRNRHEILPLITPYLFETFDFDGFDVVLTITSADAKSIITKPSTLHVCYCLTPTRYIWSGFWDYLTEPGMNNLNFFIKPLMLAFSSSLRRWDYISSKRPDKYIAISKEVKMRINKYYKENSEVIYPPVDTEVFLPKKGKTGDYFLIVSRLVPYKKIDYVIRAFNKLQEKLIIIGRGIEEERLKKMSRRNILFINNNLTDEKLCWYYQNCRALIFPGEEDFGLTAAEALSCGKPVLGYASGGMTEIIRPRITGELYFEQSEDVLAELISDFQESRYSPKKCRESVIFYTKKRFKTEFKKSLEKYWETWKKNGISE